VTVHAERAQRFADLHRGPGLFVMPNPWDAGTARILAGLGFEALATTSAGLAWALGRRDGEGAVSRDEALAHAAVVVEAADLPVNGDLENGFGDDPAAVVETIRGAAGAGLAGCSIEDSTSGGAEPIYPLAQAVERVAAAVDAARTLGRPFTLTARAENFLHGRPDLDDTLERLLAFEAAGADVLYAPGLPGLEALAEICATVTKPVNVLPVGGLATATLDELRAAGARRVSLGSVLARAALGGLLRGAREIREQGRFAFGADAPSSAELEAFMAESPGEDA
jgi:2-methylisocitrate lyase-like PEP mutase family enzyme